MTTVVHCKVRPYDIYIGRPSEWGNPFVIGQDGTREEVVTKYETWLLGQPELLAKVPILKDKILGCFCTPLPCHGDVLVKYADQVDKC